jgi:hypothetical protein
MIQSAYFRFQNLVTAENGLRSVLAAISPCSLVAADIQHTSGQIEALLLWSAGLATYTINRSTYTDDADSQTFWTSSASTLFPRAAFDVTDDRSRDALDAREMLYVSEQVSASGANSYPVGDTTWPHKRGHLGRHLGAGIAAGASGTIRLLAANGRYRDITATNRGNVALATDGYALVIFSSRTANALAFPL